MDSDSYRWRMRKQMDNPVFLSYLLKSLFHFIIFHNFIVKRQRTECKSNEGWTDTTGQKDRKVSESCQRHMLTQIGTISYEYQETHTYSITHWRIVKLMTTHVATATMLYQKLINRREEIKFKKELKDQCTNKVWLLSRQKKTDLRDLSDLNRNPIHWGRDAEKTWDADESFKK